MASQHLGNVSQTIKVGREMALLGNYDGALEKYSVVHADVQRYVETERPSTYQRNWQNSSTLQYKESELVGNVSDSQQWFTKGGSKGHIGNNSGISSSSNNNSSNVNNSNVNSSINSPAVANVGSTSSSSSSRQNYIPVNNNVRPVAQPTVKVKTDSGVNPWNSNNNNNNNNNPNSSGNAASRPTRVSTNSNSNVNSRVGNVGQSNAVKSTSSARGSGPTTTSSTTASKGARKAPLDMGKGNNTGNSANNNNSNKKGTNTANASSADQINGIARYTNETYPELVKIIEQSIMDAAPNVKFTDIAELDDAKRVLEESVMYPIWMPEFFQGIRKPWKGVQQFGPPGTGKTMLAKAVATECKTTFFNVSASALASKFRGESEQLVHILFEMARHYAPSTIFLDELDSISSKRGVSGEHEASRRVKSQLLIEMDGASAQQEGKPVAVLGATNFPWDLDEALIRRLEKRIHIPLPGRQGRTALQELSFKNIKLAPDVDLDLLAEATDGYSGSDLCTIARDAAMAGLRKLRQAGVAPSEIIRLGKEVTEAPITMEALTDAITRIHSSVAKQDLDRYGNWAQEFGAV